VDIAASTRSRVAGSTFVRRLDTREAVWGDTPARAATSLNDGPRWALPDRVMVTALPEFESLEAYYESKC